jgi:hypothetical protein
MKALGTGWSGGVKWREFEVVRAESGAPGLVLHGKAAELARRRGMVRWLLALSHTDASAVASVVVEDGAAVREARGARRPHRRGAAAGSARPRPRARR